MIIAGILLIPLGTDAMATIFMFMAHDDVYTVSTQKYAIAYDGLDAKSQS